VLAPPRLGISEGKLVAMPARMSSRWSSIRLGIEAAVGPESHQQAKGLVAQALRQLHGVVPRIEDKDGKCCLLRAAFEQRPHLGGSDLMHIVRRFHSLC
jgi:hypothetical protein